MNSKSELVKAKSTPEAFLVPQKVGSRIFVFAGAKAVAVAFTVTVAAFGATCACAFAPVLVVCLRFVFRIVVVTQNSTRCLFFFFLRSGNQVVRKRDIENKIRADGQFNLPIYAQLIVAFCFDFNKCCFGR